MSTITDYGALVRDVRSAALIAGSIVLAWFALMLLSMVIFEPTDTALAIVRDTTILERIPAHVRFTAMSENTITFRSDEPGFVRDIYGAGAILVFPALANGCVALRPQSGDT